MGRRRWVGADGPTNILELVRRLVGGLITIFTQRSGVIIGIARGNSGSYSYTTS